MIEQHIYQKKINCNAKGGSFSTGDKAWIGSRVIILPNVSIGEGTVAGAGAFVTKNIEPFSVNGGIPSKKIGKRNRNVKYEFNSKYLPFN